ncbi:hypothetical protein JW859_02800 [bacterium]|nr:hypothetical protein [bacterium]
MRVALPAWMIVSGLLMAIGVWWLGTADYSFDIPHQAAFGLDPLDGHPVAQVDSRHLHFSWDGDVVAITPALREPVIPKTEFWRVRELTSTVEAGGRRYTVDGDIIAVAVSPELPTGGTRCVALTVGRDRQTKFKHYGGGAEAWTKETYEWNKFYGLIFDYETGEKQHEVDLYNMLLTSAGQIRRQHKRLLKAEIFSASIGPDGGLGLAVIMRNEWENRPIESGLSIKLVDGSTWYSPSMTQVSQDNFPAGHELIVGQKNDYIWCIKPDQSPTTLFYDYSGHPWTSASFGVPLKYRRVHQPKAAVIATCIQQITYAFAAGWFAALLGSAVFAGVWHSLPRRRTG